MKTLLPSLIFCCWAVGAATAHAERPNIIMFLIDDQNPSSIATFDGDTYTPNLDRIAEREEDVARGFTEHLIEYALGRPLRLAVASAQGAPVLGQCDGEAEWAHAIYWKNLV